MTALKNQISIALAEYVSANKTKRSTYIQRGSPLKITTSNNEDENHTYAQKVKVHTYIYVGTHATRLT